MFTVIEKKEQKNRANCKQSSHIYLKTTILSFALIVYAVWYPINITTRYFVPSLFLFPIMFMELATVCTEMGKVNSMKPLGISSTFDRVFF